MTGGGEGEDPRGGRSGSSSGSTGWSPAGWTPADAETLGKLAVFSGVSAFPIRVKCASLPWHALKDGTGRADTDP